MILRKWTTLLVAALLLEGGALAEVYEGATAALQTISVIADASGTVASIEAEAGRRVSEGDALVTLSGEKTFANQDGTVSVVSVEAGQETDGEVLSVAPMERYTIFCTVDSAYQSAESTLVHSGETLYIRCTADGTHRALGVVTAVDGAEYRVLTMGGELYVGETVYLYRDADFAAEQRVGIGTVLTSDAEVYEAEGAVTRLQVRAGDIVERGQLLYEIGGGSVSAPVNGIVTEVSAKVGDGIEKGRILAQIVPEDQICVKIQVDEAAASGIHPGQTATLTPVSDEESILAGTVLDVAWTAEDGAYTVRIVPETTTGWPIGMSVTVRV